MTTIEHITRNHKVRFTDLYYRSKW